MKITISIMGALLFFGLAGLSSAQENDASNIQLTAEANYGSWDANNTGNSGSQYMGVWQASYTSTDWGLAATGKGAKNSYQTTIDPERYDVSAVMDTVITGYYGRAGNDWFFRGGLDINLPTGKHALTSRQIKQTITDPISQDLMITTTAGQGLITTYGRGLNFAPNILIGRKFGNAAAGISVRYEVAGEYDPTSDIPDDNIKPGSSTLIAFNSAWGPNADNIFIIGAAHTSSEAEKVNGRDIFRAGDGYSAEFRYLRNWDEFLSGIAVFALRSQAKNEVVSDSGVLNSELSNSNNNSWELFGSLAYKWSKEIKVFAVAGYKSVSANGYSADHYLFDGGRNVAFIEPGITYSFGEKMYITVKLRYTDIRDKRDAFSQADSEYRVINFGSVIAYKF